MISDDNTIIMYLKMDNQEELATQGAQKEEKQNKNTTQYVFDITICKQQK